jgi:L-asparaginase/Glu-tRNA(Gln) amidotransferase subunit D
MKGGVSLETYSMGREFQNAGIIAGGDMTTEACTTKLAYLIGCYDSKEAVEKLIAENIRGEITCQGDFPQKYFSHRDKR